MLPIGLINAAKGHPIMVELKTGESYNGLLDNIDNFMNVFLKEAVHTSPDGKQFKKVKEVYIRGNNIKYITFDSGVLETVRKQQQEQQQQQARLRKQSGPMGLGPREGGAGPGAGGRGDYRGGRGGMRGRGRGRGRD